MNVWFLCLAATE